MKNFYPIIEDLFVGQVMTKDYLYNLCVDYYKFLALLGAEKNNTREKKIFPPSIITRIWREHLQYNENYNELCIKTCGEVLNFYANVQGSEKATNTLFKKKYGRKPVWISFDNMVNMQIIVRSLDGKARTISVPNDACAIQLKQIIDDREGIPIWHQKLIFIQQELNDNLRLVDYGITTGSTIHQKLQLRGD